MWERILAEARPMLDALLRLHGIPTHPAKPVLLPEPVAPDEGGARLLTRILTDAAHRITAAGQATAAEGERGPAHRPGPHRVGRAVASPR